MHTIAAHVRADVPGEECRARHARNRFDCGREKRSSAGQLAWYRLTGRDHANNKTPMIDVNVKNTDDKTDRR
jgi:hypothetical protein